MAIRENSGAPEPSGVQICCETQPRSFCAAVEGAAPLWLWAAAACCRGAPPAVAAHTPRCTLHAMTVAVCPGRPSSAAGRRGRPCQRLLCVDHRRPQAPGHGLRHWCAAAASVAAAAAAVLAAGRPRQDLNHSCRARLYHPKHTLQGMLCHPPTPPPPLPPATAAGCTAGVLSTGHCHPRVVEAIQRQAGSIIMAQQNIFPASRPMVCGGRVGCGGMGGWGGGRRG